MPPCRISRPLGPSGPAILLGLCSLTTYMPPWALNRSCTGGANLSKTDDWGAPKCGIVVSRMDMAVYPTSDSGYMVVAVCMYNNMAWVYMEVEVSMQAH
jgi:hypothetical protein